MENLTDIKLLGLERNSRRFSKEFGALVKEFARHAHLIDLASHFMRSHCHLSNLRESTVAAQVGIGGDFLSMLFPRYTGKKYIEQLTLFRVERAKQLLRRKKPIRLFEVARACGYKYSQSLRIAMERVGAGTPKGYRNHLQCERNGHA